MSTNQTLRENNRNLLLTGHVAGEHNMHIAAAAEFFPYATFLLPTIQHSVFSWPISPSNRASRMSTLLQGFFDEDSMEEFIASETEESSMSLSSEDEKKKK